MSYQRPSSDVAAAGPIAALLSGIPSTGWTLAALDLGIVARRFPSVGVVLRAPRAGATRHVEAVVVS